MAGHPLIFARKPTLTPDGNRRVQEMVNLNAIGSIKLVTLHVDGKGVSTLNLYSNVNCQGVPDVVLTDPDEVSRIQDYFDVTGW